MGAVALIMDLRTAVPSIAMKIATVGTRRPVAEETATISIEA
jgi:hypothetical protein